jgi:site-specific DNA-methyltransferase (adenine-specific)
MINLMLGDCLERMKEIPDGSIDMVLTDPPYGTTACKWDSVIPFEPMWAQLKRVTKKNGAIVMTASQPFTSALVMSNVSWFKYQWIWQKTRPTGHVHAKNKPMKKHEDVLVFSSGTTVHASQSATRMTYNPQGLVRTPEGTKRKRIDRGSDSVMSLRTSHRETDQNWTNFPNSIIEFSNPNNGSLHPTQKPVALMEYLIKTYTQENETVLDFTMGSGTTGVACKNLNRNFIGIELDPDYFKIAEDRINNSNPLGDFLE